MLLQCQISQYLLLALFIRVLLIVSTLGQFLRCSKVLISILLTGEFSHNWCPSTILFDDDDDDDDDYW